MLTEARAEYAWLAAGAQNVQQQALRDFSQAMRNFYAGTDAYPAAESGTWTKDSASLTLPSASMCGGLIDAGARSGCQRSAGCGFGGHAPYQNASPTASPLTMPGGGTSHSLWSLEPVPAPRTGETVGVDRGVVITAALSTGEKLHCPGMSSRERARLRKAERRKARAAKGSPKQQAERARIARLRAREADRRKDWSRRFPATWRGGSI